MESRWCAHARFSQKLFANKLTCTQVKVEINTDFYSIKKLDKFAQTDAKSAPSVWAVIFHKERSQFIWTVIFSSSALSSSFAERNSGTSSESENPQPCNHPFDSPGLRCCSLVTQMAAIIRKPSWSPKLSNGAVITTMENQTSFGGKPSVFF